MLFAKVLATAGLLAASVLADGAAIVAALDKVAADTVQLGEAVKSWDGGLLATGPIVAQSVELLADIVSATGVAKRSDPLNDIEAFTVAGTVSQLAGDVNATLTALIAARPRFDRVLLSPVILGNLKLEKDATDCLSAAITEKVPEGLRGAAGVLASQIDASFDLAIDAYHLF